MNRNSSRRFLRIRSTCRAIADRPFLVLGLGFAVTLCCAAMVIAAVIARSGPDALAWGLLTTTCLTGTMFGWIGSNIRKARPTPEQLLIQEVLDDLAMEEAASRAAEKQRRAADQTPTPPAAPWEKPPDWWKGD